ncbi:hypothetical protein ZWY2020_011294 [Hordeum vulgare]|nr:hypothetical protein ZWY2020_011294 [Hordeum vulgare]
MSTTISSGHCAEVGPQKRLVWYWSSLWKMDIFLGVRHCNVRECAVSRGKLDKVGAARWGSQAGGVANGQCISQVRCCIVQEWECGGGMHRGGCAPKAHTGNARYGAHPDRSLYQSVVCELCELNRYGEVLELLENQLRSVLVAHCIFNCIHEKKPPGTKMYNVFISGLCEARKRSRQWYFGEARDKS